MKKKTLKDFKSSVLSIYLFERNKCIGFDILNSHGEGKIVKFNIEFDKDLEIDIKKQKKGMG